MVDKYFAQGRMNQIQEYSHDALNLPLRRVNGEQVLQELKLGHLNVSSRTKYLPKTEAIQKRMEDFRSIRPLRCELGLSLTSCLKDSCRPSVQDGKGRAHDKHDIVGDHAARRQHANKPLRYLTRVFFEPLS